MPLRSIRRLPNSADFSVALVMVPVLLIQVVSGAFFIFRLLADLFGWSWAFVPWEYFELFEILASTAIIFGVIISGRLLILSVNRMRRVEAQLDAAAGNLQVHVEALFDKWGLTGSERNVAMLVVKGFSNAEISAYRKTSESTTKSQVSSVFRKSGLTNRQQLVSLVVEDLLDAIDMNGPQTS